MLLYSRLIIIWEQHGEQIPWLAKRAHQTLDKTGIFSPNHRHTFRSDAQPYRAGCRKCHVAPAIDGNPWGVASQLFAYDISELTYFFAGQEVNEQG